MLQTACETVDDPSGHPPAAPQLARVSYQDMLRQQSYGTAPTHDPQPDGTAPAVNSTYSAGSSEVRPDVNIAESSISGQNSLLPCTFQMASATPGRRAYASTNAKLILLCFGGYNAGMSEASVPGHREDAHGVLGPGRSQHSSRAQVTPGGLRLYDAQGSCSIVPLEELRQVMQKLRFSR